MGLADLGRAQEDRLTPLLLQPENVVLTATRLCHPSLSFK